MNESEVIREAMRILGKRRSERKTLSCRENAKRKRKPKHISKPLAITVPSDQNGQK